MPVEYKQRLTRPPVNPGRWPQPGMEFHGPCNCCGSSWRNGDGYVDFNFTYNKGILILDDKYGDESDDGSTQVSHVETKQGTLTVVIKYA